MSRPPVGASAAVGFVVTEDATAIALGSGDVPVLGTPKVVALVEAAAVAAVTGHLDDGDTTVGIRIAVDHRQPTGVGSSVEASATVVSVDGRRIEFTVAVSEIDRVVATGEHTRVVVDRARFVGGN